MTLTRTYISCAILSILSTSVYANDQTDTLEIKSEKSSIQLSPLVVKAIEDKDVGITVYTKEDLEKTPNNKKTISELLKVNSNVQFTNSEKAAGNQAEIHASDISIHGALPYNNAFLFNGMSINNDINPYESNSGISDPTSLKGNSQAVTLNTDLLCNLEVLDSNVSAQYGKFTGGVISATTCAPKTVVGKIHGNINYDYTSSDWYRFNYIDSSEESDFEDTTQTNAQKDFTQKGISLNTYGRLTESLGFNLGLSQRKSDIRSTSKLSDARPYNEDRTSTNINAELFYNPSDDLEIKFSAQNYSDESTRFNQSIITNGYNQTSDNQSLQLSIRNDFPLFSLTNNINYQKKKNERLSTDGDNFTWWKTENKNWSDKTSVSEGATGTIFNEQQTLEYSTSAKFIPFEFFKTTHNFHIGAGFTHNEAAWHRPNDYTQYFLPTGFNTDCIKNDGSIDIACDPDYIPSKKATGQYSKTKTVHGMGSIDVQQDSWFAFIEDRLQWDKRFEAVLGLRFDYDSLSKNKNIAPRTAFHYKPFGDQSLKFSTGWNRYYDRYLYNFDLQDGILNFQNQYTRTDLNSDWTPKVSPNKNNIKRSDLDLPYADEWMLALSSEFKNIRTQIKYVNREYKDQYHLIYPDPNNIWTREYSNNKNYSSENITLDIGNILPFNVLDTKHRMSLAVSYSNTKRDYNNANDSETKEYSHVLYNGKLITPNNLPASDFNVPLTARISWDFTPNFLAGLNISNFLVYKPTFQGLTKSSSIAKPYTHINNLPVIYSYNDTSIPSVVRWDMRASYTHQISQNIHAIWGLTINNVTNRHNKYLDTDYYLKSEIGRQFIADITFKF
ncbi:TonB-dependent receptor plug domain-containing protein [Acinetobacter faecalis]|uniref:TonB-dependent receptor plug domain-containing protein n=1 Tax=Acinetobacter faecalis TaxID=2665161 RepID=UPI002A914EF4|nr:TonB-dependent receptor plug domain-containing protein [Acinetobacter faecalis]MDY6467054.1 TonB-dependent receptor plug domain-containing protein [Acinetobacter faecalis]MDY6481152.1 TonB-dependent receptor plug domain-containing protein [Acinetobacter faecalis]